MDPLCAEKISSAVASVAWTLYAPTRGADGRRTMTRQMKSIQSAGTPSARTKSLTQLLAQGLVEEVAEHPFLTLLEDGNDEMPGLTVRRTIQIHLDLAGEAFLALQRDVTGVPIAMWPLAPSWVVSTPTPREPTFRVSYRGAQFTIDARELLWLKTPNPSDIYGRGSGIGLTLGDEIAIDESTAKYLGSCFANNARSDIIGSAPDLTSDDTKRLEQSWVQAHQGPSRNSRPMFVNKEISVKEFGSNFREQQLAQLRDQQRDVIWRTLGGIPPELNGHLVASNRSTIDGSATIMASQVLVPRLELLRSFFQKVLSDSFDPRFILGYEDPAPRTENSN